MVKDVASQCFYSNVGMICYHESVVTSLRLQHIIYVICDLVLLCYDMESNWLRNCYIWVNNEERLFKMEILIIY